MKPNLTIILMSLVALLPVAGFSQKNGDPKEINDKMQWFADAKLGIFIHAGIYAVDGIDESWSFHNNKISYADYMKQLKGFTLKKYGLGNGTKLQPKTVGKISWSSVPGLVYIDVPANVADKYITVLKVKLDKPLSLYKGHGGLN